MVWRWILLGLGLAASSDAQTDPCDPNLLRLAHIQHTAPYSNRGGGRCEGVYQPQRSVPPMFLASYTTVAAQFDPQRDPSIALKWTNPRATPLHLSCYSLAREGRYIYQMDAVPDPRRPAFEWPMDVLRSLKLEPDNLALLGWTTLPTPLGEKQLRLPVEVARAAAAKSVRGPQLLVIPGYDLLRPKVTVEKVDQNGATTARLVDHADLAGLSFSAGIPVRLEPRHLKITDTGYYLVTLGANITGSGAPATLEVYLYYEK